MNIDERARRIKIFLMDVDGVLTNGWLFHMIDTAGQLVELKGMHTHDSFIMAELANLGFQTGLISGRRSSGVAERAKMLKIKYVFQERRDKKNVFEAICADAGVPAESVLYIGDDLPDIPVLTRAGLAVAVADARPEVKAVAHWVTHARGGEGVLREVAERCLRAQGLWDKLVERFV